MSADVATHRCCACQQSVPDPYGHYFAVLYGRSGFYCWRCFETAKERTA